jgi:arylsulfatase
LPASPRDEEAAVDRPKRNTNVLLLSVDTLRADHLGCYGYARMTSPWLDALAAEGVRFRWALVQWPKTGPSVASMFTSTYGSTSGVARLTGRIPIPEDLQLFAESLKTAGYETFGVVSNASLHRSFGYQRGFDEYVEVFRGGAPAPDVVTACREVMDLWNRDAPYFLWAHFLDPHGPYEPPGEYDQLYQGDEAYRKAPVADVAVGPAGRAAAKERVGVIPHKFYVEGRNQIRDYVTRYDAEIRYMDDVIAEFMDWMREQGNLEDTLILFTADHGESLGSHGLYFSHGRFPYEESTQVPLVIHHPKLAPAVIQEPVALLDLVPTVLDFLDLPALATAEGQSVLPWLEQGQAVGPVRDVFTESGYKGRFTVAMRRGPWKLIHIADEDLRAELTGAEYELYHVENDPAEQNNLFDSAPPILEQLKETLDLEVRRRHAAKGARQRPPPKKLRPELESMLEQLGYVDGQ